MKKQDASNKSTRNYDNMMKWLALPYVVQCAWRSFWPEVYNDRFVYWDVWMSSIFIGRMLATIGEITWIIQVSWGILKANQEIRALRGGKMTFFEQIIDCLAILASVFCTLAEFFCNYAMFTECYWYNIIETSLWTVALGSLIPCCLFLL